MSYPHAKLPDWHTLRRLYVQQDLSLTQIGQRYGVPAKTVYNNMSRRAKKHGYPWPLKQPVEGWQRRQTAKIAQARWDSVSTVLLRAELRECSERFGVTFVELAARAGMSRQQIHAITGGFVPRVSRRTCERLMGAVLAVEDERGDVDDLREVS
jgi:transposase